MWWCSRCENCGCAVSFKTPSFIEVSEGSPTHVCQTHIFCLWASFNHRVNFLDVSMWMFPLSTPMARDGFRRAGQCSPLRFQRKFTETALDDRIQWKRHENHYKHMQTLVSQGTLWVSVCSESCSVQAPGDKWNSISPIPPTQNDSNSEISRWFMTMELKFTN